MRIRRGMWLTPIFIVVAILAVWLALDALPAAVFGSEWAAIRDELWRYLPWLIPFALGLYVLTTLGGRWR